MSKKCSHDGRKWVLKNVAGEDIEVCTECGALIDQNSQDDEMNVDQIDALLEKCARQQVESEL